MDNDTITDLKQFISTVLTQQTQEIRLELREELRTELRKVEEKLGQKIDDLSAFVATALDTSNDTNEGRLNDHEKRIGALERQEA